MLVGLVTNAMLVLVAKSMPFGGTMTADPTISEEHRPDEALLNENPALNPAVGATRVSGVNADREVDAPDINAADGC
jgi:hypothetical protein